MNSGIGLEPEEQRRQAATDLLMLRVALALLNDARRVGRFESDQNMLNARVAKLVEELDDHPSARLSPETATVQAMLLAPDQISLSASYSESSAVVATLRSDGVLLDQGTTVEVSAERVDESKLSQDKRDEMNRAIAEFEAKRARPQFSGRRFLRALSVEPQPNSEVQILAVELFDDGLFVHYTFDQEARSLESLMTDDPLGRPEPKTRILLEDDLGTEYYESGAGGNGGVQVVHGASGFAPAVPKDASTLRISTDSGTIDLSLYSRTS